MSSMQKIFHYNAHGHGLSGIFRRPLEQVIDVQAGISLPIIGGHGSSRVEKFRFNEILSFKTAYSHVSGSQNKSDGSFTTLVTATVEGLNVLDVVTADRVVARISSHHPVDGEEAHIIPLGSKFENLRIAGCKVEVELNVDLFCRQDTFGSFREQFAQMAREQFSWEERENDLPKSLQERYKGVREGFRESKGAVLCSLVKDIKITCPGVKRCGHILIVPQFGAIFLAEILLKRSSRRLTMLRLELGSPVEGHAAVCDVDGNGTTYP